jgi:DNA-directed RNA polymerase subunit RPC12/RpoP
MNYFDMLMLEPDPLSFDNDDESFDELDIEAVDACPRCGTEFDAEDELEHIEKQGVCRDCLSELALEAAEDSMVR